MKEIALTKGMVALVDDVDYELLSKFTWCASESSPGVFYAARYEKGVYIYMHRMIMGFPEKLRIDHIDNNGLNNQRDNLRYVTQSQNLARGTARTNLGYKGVYVNDVGNFRAKTTAMGIKYNLGTFKTMEGAARAYDKAAIKYFGDFASLNFPKSDYL